MILLKNVFRELLEDTHFWHRVMRPNDVAVIDETNDLRSLVAKTQSEEHAKKIADFLSANNIEARTGDGAIFNPKNQTEQPSWGIYVKSTAVVDAGELLHRQKLAHGLSFDPYVKGGK